MPIPPILIVTLNPCFDRVIRVPGLALGDHARGELVSVHPAGKGVNVARILAMLGSPCTLAGFVGEYDDLRFDQSFGPLDVTCDLIETGRPTRQNTTLIDPVAGRETHIREAGLLLPQVAVDSLARKLKSLARPKGYVVFTGSLPPEMPPESLVRLIDICRKRGTRIVVDSSGPGLEAVRQTRGLWLIKPNREELAELTGDWRATLRRGRKGPKPARRDGARPSTEPLLAIADHVAVTLGADGACLFTRRGSWRGRLSAPPPKPITKTVGCGDAFLAGFLHRHAAGAPLPDCLRFAIACGTAAAFQLLTGEIDPADVQACLAKTCVSTG
jgi:1-phosphofructokinase family hexose kinase